MTETTIDRLAITMLSALCGALSDVSAFNPNAEWRKSKEADREKMRDVVRAILREMREPSAEALKAVHGIDGYCPCCGYEGLGGGSMVRPWRTMIDSILEGK